MSAPQRLDERLLRRYLLGDRLSQAERDSVEHSYFHDDSCFERLCELEDDLIAAYIRGALSSEERARFERHFLAAKRRRDRYEVMRALAGCFFRGGPRGPSSFLRNLRDIFLAQPLRFRAAALGVGAVVIAAICLLGADDLRRRNAGANDLAPSASLPARRSPTAAFILTPGLLRSGSTGGNRIDLAPGSLWLTLRLQTAASGEYRSFAAVLETASGEELIRENRLRPSEGSIDFEIAAGSLSRGGDYVISLTGIDASGTRDALPSYAFHVSR